MRPAIAFLIIVCMVIFDEWQDRRDRNAFFKEFPRVKKADSLAGLVLEVRCPPKMSCANKALIVFEKQYGFVVVDGKDIANQVYLDDILNVGCHVLKKENNDTLIVKKEGKIFQFLIAQ